jgi:hypothetical protein
MSRLPSDRWSWICPLVLCLAAPAAVSCDGDGSPPAAPIVVPAASGLAVVNSNFQSTSISLLDGATGALVKDDCVNSGSTAGSLSPALSGDVTLPTRPQPNGELALIDRGNGVISWLDPATCTVKRQLSVNTGFSANPTDLVSLSGDKAYVPRFEANSTRGKEMFDGGDDLLIIDPAGAKILGRIDMAAYAAPVAGKTIQARPDRVLLADGQLFVTLSSQDDSFMNAGEGRVVVIDPMTDKATKLLALPGLKSCSAMDYIAATKTVLVVCGGSFTDADQAAGSGLVLIDAGVTPAVVSRTIPASAVTKQPLNFSSIVAISDAAVLLTGIGRSGSAKHNIPAVPDILVQLNLTTGAVTRLLERPAFEIGRGTSSGALALIPRGSDTEPRVQFFQVTGEVVVPGDLLDVNPSRGLPPREIAWY